jgi:hypothetical protein
LAKTDFFLILNMSFRVDRRTDRRTDDKARHIAAFSGENALKSGEILMTPTDTRTDTHTHTDTNFFMALSCHKKEGIIFLFLHEFNTLAF